MAAELQRYAWLGKPCTHGFPVVRVASFYGFPVVRVDHATGVCSPVAGCTEGLGH